MSHPELVIPVVLNEKRGELFATQFMLAGREIIPANDHTSYMDHIHFLEEAAAQLAWSVSSHVFSPESETALHQKFTGYYNLDQIISDIRTYQRPATVHDYKMSGSDDLRFVNPGARVSTAKDLVYTATFSPFTLSFHDVEPEHHDRQATQIRNVFPNLHTKNPILFVSPIVTINYPVVIHTHGFAGHKTGELHATIATASARYVKTYGDRLIEGVHTRTLRTWDVDGTQQELDYLLQLSMQVARARQYNAMTGGVIFSGDMSGNSK